MATNNKVAVKIDSDEEMIYESIPNQENRILIVYRAENTPDSKIIIETFNDDEVAVIEESQKRLRNKLEEKQEIESI